MITKKILRSRSEWLDARRQSIGGSEAAAVLGMSPWLANTDLWDIKAGRVPAREDLSDNPLVVYGTNAEPLLRGLFALDFPEYKVMYEENNLFRNDLYPWAHTSLDGWLEDSAGRRGVLEIKTASPMRAAQIAEWNGKIPEHYFVQVLHEMAVYDADFAVLKAQIKRGAGADLRTETRHYFVERSEVQEEIEYLMDAEREFWQSVSTGVRPSRLLPEI